jgi:hypothetical protein
LRSELQRLHLALGFLVLSVVMPILGLIHLELAQDSDLNPFLIAMIYLPALPLAIADSIWNLGEKMRFSEQTGRPFGAK